MTIKHKKRWILTIILFSFFSITCRKDIPVSNAELEKLFGTWEWSQSSGGFAGQTITAATAGYSQAIEFKKNGVCIWYKNGKHTNKMQFILTKGSSIYTAGIVPLIKYKDTGLFDKEDTHMTQSLTFGGNDTLFLYDECYDCYTNVYIRQK